METVAYGVGEAAWWWEWAEDDVDATLFCGVQGAEAVEEVVRQLG